MNAATSPERSQVSLRIRAGMRIAIAVLLVTMVVAYSVGIISGEIPENRKIDAVHFALIVLAVVVACILVQPEILERFKRVKLSGFELEMLVKVREKQAVHESQLEDIRLILPLLLPETERQHLFHIDRGRTSGHRGNHALRAELRRLRSIGLLRMKKDKHVGEMKDGVMFDLADFVELTPLGERWVRRIREIEKAEGPQGVHAIDEQRA
jgi:hypothetical protein